MSLHDLELRTHTKPIMAELDRQKEKAAKFKKEAFNARKALVAVAKELSDFHDHTIDMGWHDCEGIPGGCTVVAALNTAKEKA